MKRIFILILALFALHAAGCASKTNSIDLDEELPENPSGTIVGNPAPTPGTLKIYTPDQKLKYIVNIYEAGHTAVISLDTQGNVLETVSGTFTLAELGGTSALQALEVITEISADLRRFDMTVTFADGSTLNISLYTDANNQITASSVQINGAQAIVQVEFTDTAGATHTVTIVVNDRPTRACLPPSGLFNPAAEESYNNALTSLAQGLIPTARDQFDAALTADSSLAEAHFGAAITRLILIPETPSGMEIQSGLGQETFTADDIFGPTGYWARKNEWVRSNYTTAQPTWAGIPWAGTSPDVSDLFTVGDLLALASDGYTAEEFQVGIAGLHDEWNSVIQHLESARDCTSFEFIVPGRLFFSSTNVPIHHADLTFLTATQYQIQLALSLATAWHFDIDLGAIFDENGDQEMSDMELLDQLNQFFRIRDTGAFSAARTELLNSTTLMIEGFEELATTSSFGALHRDAVTEPALEEMQRLFQSISDSFGGLVTVPGVSPEIAIDLTSAFTDPPDLDEIGMDPFVLEFGDIKLVEAFFQQAVNRVLTDFELGNLPRMELVPLVRGPLFAPALFGPLTSMPIAEGIAP